MLNKIIWFSFGRTAMLTIQIIFGKSIEFQKKFYLIFLRSHKHWDSHFWMLQNLFFTLPNTHYVRDRVAWAVRWRRQCSLLTGSRSCLWCSYLTKNMLCSYLSCSSVGVYRVSNCLQQLLAPEYTSQNTKVYGILL